MTPRLTTRSIELKRVVVTGMGAVSPLGNDVATSWSAALKGVSGVSLIDRFENDVTAAIRTGDQVAVEPVSGRVTVRRSEAD